MAGFGQGVAEISSVFSYRITETVKVTSANSDFQLVRIPWASPWRRRGRLKKLNITNYNGVAGLVKLWDQDASSSTPPKRGSSGAELLSYGVAASGASGVSGSNTIIDEDDLTKVEFDAGIELQGSQINMQVTAEIEIF